MRWPSNRHYPPSVLLPWLNIPKAAVERSIMNPKLERHSPIRMLTKPGLLQTTWKRKFKLPWRKAGLLKSPRWSSGFGPVGCQQRTLSAAGWHAYLFTTSTPLTSQQSIEPHTFTANRDSRNCHTIWDLLVPCLARSVVSQVHQLLGESTISSHTMHWLKGFRQSTPPQNCRLIV